MKVKVTETSRATYTSSTHETTIENLVEGGWRISEAQISELIVGGHINLMAPNGMRRIRIEQA